MFSGRFPEVFDCKGDIKKSPYNQLVFNFDNQKDDILSKRQLQTMA